MFNAAQKSGGSYDAGRTPSSSATMIARGVKVEGEFSSQGDVVIEGEVHGTLATSGLLTVGSEAKIKADVKAGSAIISGNIEGNLTVGERLEVKSTAKITGDVTAETITIEGGAVLLGRMSIGAKGTLPAGAPANGRRERAPVLADTTA